LKIHLQPGPRQLLRLLFSVLVLLLAMHAMVAIGHLYFRIEFGALTRLLDMDLEANLPALYNVLLFFLGAFLFYLVGRSEPAAKARSPWYLMAGVFVFLGFDEGAQIHEKLMLVTLRLMGHEEGSDGTLGWLYYAWTIPYGIAALALFAVLAPWFLRLETRLRWGFLVAGAIYIGGALVMEAYSGKVAESYMMNAGPDDDHPWMPCFAYPKGQCFLYTIPAYVMAYTVEEVMEMTGLILCIGVLADALERRRVRVEVSFGGERVECAAVQDRA
jgi:hypothetical protein